jgi:hypothetical protein
MKSGARNSLRRRRHASTAAASAGCCDHLVRFSFVESINTTIKAVLRPARRMQDEARLFLKLKWATAPVNLSPL